MKPLAVLFIVTCAAPCAAILACASSQRSAEAPVVDLTIPPMDAAAAVIVEGPPESRPTGPLSRMIGRWEGIGRQNDGQTWPLAFEINSTEPGVCGTADYSTVPCRAQWICMSELGGGVLSLHETMLDDESRSRCVDNGSMTMRLESDNVIEWGWSGQGQTASGRFHRVGR